MRLDLDDLSMEASERLYLAEVAKGRTLRDAAKAAGMRGATLRAMLERHDLLDVLAQDDAARRDRR